MKLSEACAEIEEWVGYTAYDFCIGNVELKANGAYKFDIYEKTPCRDDQYFLTVEPDGRIINCNGDDCLEVSKTQIMTRKCSSFTSNLRPNGIGRRQHEQ